ncbi:MAG: radical SAM protein, partial [Thermodesulfobacteriota bacterium]
LFEDLAKDWFVTIEYGIESIYDKTLEYMNRGHNYQSLLEAIQITRKQGINIGAHIIVGFPTETRDEMLQMADEISRLKIDFLKVHNLHVVKNTPLARMYAKDPFRVFNYEEYIDFISRFIEQVSPKIVLERLFTDTPQDLLIAPRWNKTHNEILRGIEMELERRNTYQGRLFKEQCYS